MKKPERIGPYTLLEPLGRPARGHVWLASVGGAGEQVALKLVRPGDPEGRLRLLHECNTAIIFDHPNIVRIHECGEAKGVTWMAMGYLAGPHAPLTLANFRQLLLAMVHVHANGIVHADIGLENLLLDEGGDLRLAGFGSARRLGQTPPAAPCARQSNAPEQLRGQPIDCRTDIFAAGLVLYEVLTGKPPLRGTGIEVTRQILHETEPAPSVAAPGLGSGFDEVVRRGLARERGERYASAFEFLAAFDAACRLGLRVSA
jgi:serine/threonine protein kinase